MCAFLLFSNEKQSKLFNGYLFGVYYVPDTDMHQTIDDSSRPNKTNICPLRPHMWGKQTVNKQVNDGMSDVMNSLGKNKARVRDELLNWVAKADISDKGMR